MEKRIQLKKPMLIRINKHSSIHIDSLQKWNDIPVLNFYSEGVYITCIYLKYQHLEFNQNCETFKSYTIIDK